ncbi:hypothetical protein [Falsiroseomonas sp. CW058]|uniref:hypothetical protein n=1 Tax=Falsiroseomonas sp. CW058 TaxID=3388664 RepID=UPI003D322A6C
MSDKPTHARVMLAVALLLPLSLAAQDRPNGGTRTGQPQFLRGAAAATPEDRLAASGAALRAAMRPSGWRHGPLR